MICSRRMVDSNAVAGGLIAGGSLILLASVAVRDDVGGPLQQARRRRRLGWVERLSAVSTLAGASIALIGTRWVEAAVAFAAVLVIVYLALAALTYVENRNLPGQVTRERQADGGPGARVTIGTAARLGLVEDANWGVPGSWWTGAVSAEEAVQRAARQSSLRFALTHPFGAGARRLGSAS